jgi:hypothetical protein
MLQSSFATMVSNRPHSESNPAFLFALNQWVLNVAGAGMAWGAGICVQELWNGNDEILALEEYQAACAGAAVLFMVFGAVTHWQRLHMTPKQIDASRLQDWSRRNSETLGGLGSTLGAVTAAPIAALVYADYESGDPEFGAIVALSFLSAVVCTIKNEIELQYDLLSCPHNIANAPASIQTMYPYVKPIANFILQRMGGFSATWGLGYVVGGLAYACGLNLFDGKTQLGQWYVGSLLVLSAANGLNAIVQRSLVLSAEKAQVLPGASPSMGGSSGLSLKGTVASGGEGVVNPMFDSPTKGHGDGTRHPGSLIKAGAYDDTPVKPDAGGVDSAAATPERSSAFFGGVTRSPRLSSEEKAILDRARAVAASGDQAPTQTVTIFPPQGGALPTFGLGQPA